ncbi:nuclear cohesin-like protein complex subunit [Calycina marina]|uniref:Nuclear cohesin-like protein complex subunit n=1 Tax=Calycina marina TaxID=1763456 RepID=A0A9P7Z0S3_9HELO|nr:nuclear cohesin-like protein complex subunit [Calycina marina]
MDISNNDLTSSPAGSSARRKSGRVVKAPAPFISAAPSSSKRKRPVEEVESSASDIEGEVAGRLESSVESAGEEEIKKARRKAKVVKKPTAKKTKVNGTASHKSPPPMRLASRLKKAKKVLIADKGAEGLYAEIYNSGHHVNDIVAQFLGDYSQGGPAAITELVNMVIKSAGCDIRVTEDDVNDVDNVESKLGELQDEFQSQNITDYPLVSKAKSSLDFRNALVDFFTSLINTMDQTEIMYNEEVLIENIHIWFVTMSSSNSRPFRHTATLVNLTMTSAICVLASRELEKAAKIRQQLESEKKKGRNKARMLQFQTNIQNSENKYEFLLEKIKDNFDTVYVHRYRDVDPKIRHECVRSLGTWIQTLPDHFSGGAYLRYMGWMLSDTNPPMREEVVEQLRVIMDEEKNHGKMITFIERFRPRIIEIATRDAEPRVRSAAVELCESIRQAGMLEPDDIDVIGKLIYDSEPAVRKAVVKFFIAGVNEAYDLKLEELGGDDELEILKVAEDDTDSPRREWIKLKALAEVLSSYDTEDRADMPSQITKSADHEFLNVRSSESRFTLAAQSLYEELPEIRNWDVLASYVLYDHSTKPSRNTTLRTIKAAFKPADQEEIILLEMLNAVVKMGLEHLENPEKNKKRSAREVQSEDRETAARRLAELIPKLLKKFGASPQTSTVVLRLEHVLNLGVFQELRQDSTAYAKLLDEISNQFTTHADRGVLTEAGAALLHARSFEDLEEVTENKVQSLWEDTTNTLQQINKAGELSSRGSFGEAALLELSHNLARLDKLASISNCVEPLDANVDGATFTPIQILVDVVARGLLEEDDGPLDTLEDEVVMTAIRTSMFYFMWIVQTWKTMMAEGKVIQNGDIDKINELQDLFANNLIATLSSRGTNDPVRLFSTGTLLDLHILFATLRDNKQRSKAKNGVAPSHTEQSEHLQRIIKEVPDEVQPELTSIFELAEKHFARISKKTLVSPGDDEDPEDEDPEDEDEQSDDDEDDANATDSERKSEILKAEQQLCDLTGKLVLAILAKVIDASGSHKGKLRTRLQRNKIRLGPNLKEIVSHLDEPKLKAKRSHKTKAQQSTDEAKNSFKSKKIVEDDDPFADDEPEDGTVEDLWRRELLDDDPPADSHEDDSIVRSPEADDDDIMGD